MHVFLNCKYLPRLCDENLRGLLCTGKQEEAAVEIQGSWWAWWRSPASRPISSVQVVMIFRSNLSSVLWQILELHLQAATEGSLKQTGKSSLSSCLSVQTVKGRRRVSPSHLPFHLLPERRALQITRKYGNTALLLLRLKLYFSLSSFSWIFLEKETQTYSKE